MNGRARVAVACACLTAALACAADGATHQDLIAAGRRLYREGRLQSGQVVAARVQGDVPIDGSVFTCQSCHRRSGMGTTEGGRVTPALAGALLFAPDAQRRRPAYTDATLARALRLGLDAQGRPLDPLMPRYPVETADVAALGAYLRTLGEHASPGAEPGQLRFATIVADDVPVEMAEAVLSVLTTFVKEKNAETRKERQRVFARHGPRRPPEPYREWSLDVWRLTGPRSTWRPQLEAAYRARPAFALLGGIATGSWQPVHVFCEEHEIPCLLPTTETPPRAEGQFYSLYFSPGLGLEAEIMTADMLQDGLSGGVVQILPTGDTRAAHGAAALEAALARRGSHARRLELGPGPDAASQALVSAGVEASALVLWLSPDATRTLTATSGQAQRLYFSSILLDDRWDAVPSSLRRQSRVAHLFRLPGERDPALARFRVWASARGVPIVAERQQAQAYFASLAAGEGAKHLGRYPFRDYLLDLLDHDAGLTAYLPAYPRGTQGPGQRFLARGGYLVDLSSATEPRWVVP